MTAIASEEFFKITLKNKENEHRIQATILEELLKNLKKFIKETSDKYIEDTKDIKLDVLAFPKSSFGIEFSVSTSRLDLADELKKIVDTLDNTIIDITTADSDTLYDLIFEEHQYSPKQLEAFVQFTEVALDSGYDLTIESTDTSGKVRSKKITTNEADKVQQVTEVLNKQYSPFEDNITLDGKVISVSLINSHFTLMPNKSYTLDSPIKVTLFEKNTRLNGVLSEKIKEALNKNQSNIPVPSNISCEVALNGKIDLINKKFIPTKIILLNFNEIP